MTAEQKRRRAYDHTSKPDSLQNKIIINNITGADAACSNLKEALTQYRCDKRPQSNIMELDVEALNRDHDPSNRLNEYEQRVQQYMVLDNMQRTITYEKYKRCLGLYKASRDCGGQAPFMKKYIGEQFQKQAQKMLTLGKKINLIYEYLNKDISFFSSQLMQNCDLARITHKRLDNFLK